MIQNNPDRFIPDSPYARISNAIIRRINHPKQRGAAANWHEVKPFRFSRRSSLAAKARPLLSPEEQQDVTQTVALVLVTRGVLPEQKLTLGPDGDWRAVFSAVREMLGIDKHARSKRRFLAHESLPDDTLQCAPLPVFVDDPTERREVNACYRQRLARRFAYAHSIAFAAFTSDTTRTRRATYRKVIHTLRCHARAAFRDMTEPLFDGDSDSTRRVRDSRLRKYFVTGEAVLTADSLRPRTTFEKTGFAGAFATL